VKATPEPNIAESELPSCWNLTGGNKQDDLHTHVDITQPDIITLTCTAGTSSKNVTIYIIRIVSLLPDEGDEFDDGDGDADTKSYATCIAAEGDITIEATITPDLGDDPNLPDCWSFTGGEKQDQLHTKIDKTQAGSTEVICSCCDDNSKEVDMHVVEVSSLEPDEGTEIDDGDSDPNTRAFVVCKADEGYVSVIAESNPHIGEPNLPSCWVLTGGSVQNKLLTRIGKTAASTTDVFCSAGISAREVTIHVVDMTIDIWAEDSWQRVDDDPNITVLKGTKYTFRANLNPEISPWPSDIFSWSGAGSGSDPNIVITFDTEGGKTLTATFDGCSSKTVNINVFQPIIYTIGFGGDHVMYENQPDPNAWLDGIRLITDPVYVDDPVNSKNDKICITKNSSTVYLYKVKLKIGKSISFSTPIVIDASGHEEWDEDNISFVNGSETSEEARLDITGDLINTCGNYIFNIDWKYKVPSGTNAFIDIGTTEHRISLTYGAPNPSGNGVTVKRIRYVCGKALNLSDPIMCADKIFESLPGAFDLSGPKWGPTPIWQVHMGEISQCPGLARFVNRHFQMLGLTSTEVIRYCHALPDGTYIAATIAPDTQWRLVIPGTGHPSPTTHDDGYDWERLAHVDGDGNGNAYEATCLYGGTHYALGVGYKRPPPVGRFTTAEKVVEASFTSIEWQYRTGASSPYTFHKCLEDPWVEASGP